MTVRMERLPVIMLAMASLVIGLTAGLQRIGWNFAFSVSADHGGIMIGGFLGTLISFEKIIPLKKKRWFIVPLLSGASVLFFFLRLPVVSMVCLGAASMGLTLAFVLYGWRQRSWLYLLMALGALCWLAGNVLYLHSGFYRAALPWWMAFVLLIIASERLELTQFLPVAAGSKRLFAGLLVLFVLSCLLTFHGSGGLVAALALTGVSVWLLRHDVVALNLKKKGLTRYTGVALLAGYFALIVTSVFIPLLASRPLGYDAVVHSYFIGFAFSMIFAHGPIILPGILGFSQKPYRRSLYIWLLLLHASWCLRVVGDIALDLTLRKYSGVVTAAAIIGYFVTLLTTTLRNYRAHAV